MHSEISVLMYHSVGSNCSPYSVSKAEFHRQIDYVVKNYRVVSLGGVLDFLEGKRKLPQKSVAITFDDGYLDNYANAYPYLKKNRLPATIFIATDYVQEEMYLGNSYLPMLGWDQIVMMSDNNIDFGAHTATHSDLSRMDYRSAKREIVVSKAEIEKRIGKEVISFAYPFGRYKGDIVDLVRHQGFRCAFGGGGLIRKDANKFAIHRVEVKRSTSFAMFKMRLTIAMDWYLKLEQTFKRAFKNLPFMALILEGYNSHDE